MRLQREARLLYVRGMSEPESSDLSLDASVPDAGEVALPGLMDGATKGKAEPYRVLARKYRPSSFADLIGQEAMVRTLRNAFETGRIAQAYMLTGVRGVGKTTTARILARALNYETSDIDRPTIDFPEGEGLHCRAIMEGRHPDVIEMDAASHTGVDNMRDILASLPYAPTSARTKVYIIDEVHMLSAGAFNAMLKTLEEPPAHVRFVFATTEIRKVPVTILSRCQRFDLRRVEAGVMMEHLAAIATTEGVETETEALAAIARASEGSVRDALSLLDQAIARALTGEDGGATVTTDDVRDMLGLADRTRVIDLFEALMRGDIAAALAEFAEQYRDGAAAESVLSDLAAHVHLVSRIKFTPEALNDPALSETEKERGKAAADGLSTGVLSRAWQMLLKGLDEVRGSAQGERAAEMVLIRLAHAAALPGPEDAMRMLQGENSAGANGSSVPSAGSNGSPPAATRTKGATAGGSAGAISSARPSTGRPGGSDGGARVVAFASRSASALRAPADDVLDLEAPDDVAAPIESRDETPNAQPSKGAHLSLVASGDEGLSRNEGDGAPTDGRSLPAAPASVASDDPLLDPARVMATLAKIAEERRDIKLQTAFRRQFRLVSLDASDPQAPALTLASDEPPPGGLGPSVAARLGEWTSKRWSVRFDPYADGGPTLAEIEAGERDVLLREAESDPDVAAVLRQFPGARVKDVRPRGTTSTPTQDEETMP